MIKITINAAGARIEFMKSLAIEIKAGD